MGYDPKDNDVIHLLKKLKNSNGVYPPDMLALRRQGYIKQVAEISSMAGLVVGLKNIAKGGKAAAGLSSSAAGTVVEALLVIALVAEAGAVTFFYRGKVAEYLQTITRVSKVEEVASPPVLLSPIVEVQVTPSPLATLTTAVTVTVTETVTPATPSITPSSVLAASTALPKGSTGVDVQSPAAGGSDGNSGGPSVSSPQNPKGNNGNHYGQTPQPERTKEPGPNGSSSQDSTSGSKNKP
jgi:hypothetical protein